MKALLVLVLVGATNLSTQKVEPACNADSIYKSAVMKDSVDTPVELIRAGKLNYPTKLQRRGVQGKVTFDFVIDTAGKAERCSFVLKAASDSGFVASAMDAVIGEVFTPATKAGVKVRARVTQTLYFILSK